MSETSNIPVCTVCESWTEFNSTSGLCDSVSQIYQMPNQPIYPTADGWKSSETNGIPLTQCGKYSLVGGISIGRQGSTLFKTY